MRIVGLLLVATTASASPRVDAVQAARFRGAKPVTTLLAAKDAAALGWLALGAAPGKAIAALVALGTLDATTQKLVPTTAALARQLARASDPLARSLLSPDSCFVKATSGKALVIACAKRGCSGACQVVEVAATVRVRAGGMSIHDVVVDRVGDTGECGCCMSID